MPQPPLPPSTPHLALSRQRELMAELSALSTDTTPTHPDTAALWQELDSVTAIIEASVQAACHELCVVSEGLEGLLAVLDEDGREPLKPNQLHALMSSLKRQFDATVSTVHCMF